MNSYLVLGLAIGVSAGAIVVSIVLIPLLNKKGIKTEEIVQKTESTLENVEKVVDTVQAIAPIPYINIIKEAISLAHEGAGMAEQLCKISQINKDDRKQAAVQFTYDALKLADIEVTPQLASIINGASEAAVSAIPKATS